MTAYLGRARWFAGKGRGHQVVDVERVATLPAAAGTSDAPLVTVEILTVRYDDGGEADLYQMPLVHHRDEQPGLVGSFLGRHEGAWTYDAVHDPAAMGRYLALFAATAPGGETPLGGASFHRTDVPGQTPVDLDPALPATVLTGEQSNTSIRFGQQVLLKLFRQLTPGRNPDVEVHDALTRAENPYVARLHGWAQAGTGTDLVDLAMLQAFLPAADDGWELACSSVTSGVADDFADDAGAIGLALADVHAALAGQFGASSAPGHDIAARMRTRLEAAVMGLPDLASVADGLGRALDGLGGLGQLPVQRVHGDLHLGQTLRQRAGATHDGGWRLVDFEGEPAKPLEERRLPDSPWRDVAGMLRSFDYAARSAVKERAMDPAEAEAWLLGTRQAFLDGYVARRTELGEGGFGDLERLLVDAYEADKAVYEVGYEARNRPGWVDIPLAAVRRIADPHLHPDDGAAR